MDKNVEMSLPDTSLPKVNFPARLLVSGNVSMEAGASVVRGCWTRFAGTLLPKSYTVPYQVLQLGSYL